MTPPEVLINCTSLFRHIQYDEMKKKCFFGIVLKIVTGNAMYVRFWPLRRNCVFYQSWRNVLAAEEEEEDQEKEKKEEGELKEW